MAEPAEQTPDQQADALVGSGARTIAKRAMPRGAPVPEGLSAPPTIADADAYEALEPGKKFTDPEGNVRTKAWKVQEDSDYDIVPEGQQYLDPQGQLRTKPLYQDVDFTSQTLHTMAANDKERRKALERSYPGKVKQLPNGEFYVDDEGTRRKPRGITDPNASWKSAGAALTGAVAPMAGAMTGEIAGAIGGTAASPGVGTFAGGMTGAGLGSALGQGFNDLVLQLAGVYDRSDSEEISGLAKAGAIGAGGAGLGRVAGGVVAGAGGVPQAINSLAPKAANAFLGVDPEGLKTAISLADRGVAVPPSGWAKGAPHVQNMVEVFDPAFRTQKPLLQAATEHYEKTGGQLLKDLGIQDPSSITKPLEAVSTQKAGETLLRKTLGESARADAELRQVLEARKAGLLSEAGGQQEALNRAAEQSRQAAQKLIDQGYADIRQTVDQGFRVARAGHNSGDLWQGVGDQLQAVKRGFQERATVMYNQADELAAGHLPNAAGLAEAAERFAAELPEEFQRNQPGIIRQLRELAGERNPETGEVIREPTQPTFGQLHNMRSQFRSNADWYRLNSDVKNGTYKFFANRVNDILHDPHATPELRAASQQLDRADAFYRENMRVFEANQIKAVMKGLEAGEPADPKNLFNIVVREGHTDLTNKIRELVGPNLWRGVQSADLDQMFMASRSLEPGQIDGRAFGREVMDRYRSGILESVHGPQVTERLLQQARNLAALEGHQPIVARPGDTLPDVIARARTAAEAAKAAAKQDPLKTLNTEMKQLQRDRARARRDDPLGFLYDPTTGASEAVNKILGNEDLTLAAAARFGENSPEFELMRQTYVQRVLQSTMKPSQKLEQISPEMQNIMFPGTTKEQMLTLAKEMDFLMASKATDSGAGLSMAATAKVEHPWSSIAGKGSNFIPGVIRADPVGRSILEKYFAMWQKVTSSPAFLRWLEKGLKGDDNARQIVREKVQQLMDKGGTVGAGGAQAAYQDTVATPEPVE